MPRRFLGVFIVLVALSFACSGDEGGPAASSDAAITPVVSPADAVVSASESPTPSTTPILAQTPQPIIGLDIGEARRLEAEGEFETAANIYVNITLAPTDGEAVETDAVLSAARVFLALERAADARVLLEPFLQTAASEQLAGHYLLARAYAALDFWDEALAQYDLYIASGRQAVPYAYLYRAAVLLERDEPLPAALSAQTGLGLGVPAGVRPDFILSAAESYEQADSFGDAISWYRELVTASGSASDNALALARIVAIKRDELYQSYEAERDELIVSYPRTQQALDVLGDALERGETIAPTDRGLVYYRHNDYTEAEPHFREQIAVAPAAPASAVAHYYLGAILESRQDGEGALTNYALVTHLNSTAFIAADSLWWQGRILEDQNRRDEAQALYGRIVAQYSSSIWAADAAFRHGMLAYDAGQYLEANGLWATYQPAVLDPVERERLTLWQAKALLMAGQPDAAASLLEPLATAGEDDYYGIRSLSLLTGAQDQPPATREQDVDLTPSFDWEEAEGWLSSLTGLPVRDVGWSTDYRWLRRRSSGASGGRDGRRGGFRPDRRPRPGPDRDVHAGATAR